MIKRVFSMFALMCLLGFLVSCENDNLPGLGKEANTAYSGESLLLTCGGSVMSGKQITFHTYDGKKATIDMCGVFDLNTFFPSEDIPEIGILASGVVPGEILTKLENVPLTLSADGSSYLFEGTDSNNGRELTYKGEVFKEKMIMAVDIKMPMNELVNTWNYPSGLKSVSMVWESDSKINIGDISLPTNTIAQVIGPFLSPVLGTMLHSVTFQEDGNVLVSYKSLSESEWKTSPINLSQYYLKDGKIYLQLNLSQIISTVQSTRSDNILEILEILKGLLSYSSEGIPLNYTKGSDGSLKIHLNMEETKALLNLLTLDFVLEKVLTIVPSEYQPYVKPAIDRLPELLKSTTKLEFSLNLQPA